MELHLCRASYCLQTEIECHTLIRTNQLKCMTLHQNVKNNYYSFKFHGLFPNNFTLAETKICTVFRSTSYRNTVSLARSSFFTFS